MRMIWEKNWGLGIGDWGLGPIPKPQSPIPVSSEQETKDITKLLTKMLNNYNLKNK